MAPIKVVQKYHQRARSSLREGGEEHQTDSTFTRRARRNTTEEEEWEVDSAPTPRHPEHADVADDHPRRGTAEDEEDLFDVAVRNLLAHIPSPTHTSRVRYLSESCFDLNASRSKRVWIGLDLERQLTISVLIENSMNKLGTRLSVDEFKALLLDERWVSTVSRHMSSPMEQPRPSVVLDHVEYRLITVNPASPEPALRIRTSDDLYVILGAVSWNYLVRLKPLILLKLAELNEMCSQKHFEKWIVHSIVYLRDKAASQGVTPFQNDKSCQTYILDNFPEFLLNSAPPDLYKYFINEICYRHLEIFSGLLMYVLNDPSAMEYPNSLLWK